MYLPVHTRCSHVSGFQGNTFPCDTCNLCACLSRCWDPPPHVMRGCVWRMFRFPQGQGLDAYDGSPCSSPARGATATSQGAGSDAGVHQRACACVHVCAFVYVCANVWLFEPVHKYGPAAFNGFHLKPVCFSQQPDSPAFLVPLSPHLPLQAPKPPTVLSDACHKQSNSRHR